MTTIWDQLSRVERQVLLEVAQGLLKGQTAYEKMTAKTLKAKDWHKEADMEDRDWLVYRAAAIVRDRQARKTKRRK